MWLKHMDNPFVCITADSVVLGRHHTCDIRIPGADVSRRHARIFVGEEGRMIEDLNSMNGTRHNGEPISGPVPLRHGDTVQICGVLLEVDLTMAVPKAA